LVYQLGAVADAVLEQTVELYHVPSDGGLPPGFAAWQAHTTRAMRAR
jgi:hypothetical protein